MRLLIILLLLGISIRIDIQPKVERTNKVVESKKADFWLAYDKLRKWEGNYGWHKEDPGGETYAGIARRYNKNWTGWLIIDIHKRDSLVWFNKYISSVEPIVEKYYLNRWIKYEYYNLTDQQLASYVFDYHNQGAAAAIHISQLLNRQDSTFEITNRFSPQLINKLNNVDSTFIKDLKQKRINYYVRTAQNHPRQKKFLRGWIRRSMDDI